ncbi:hypothetical protein OG986_33390 [Streptomyces cellulosae]|uniref:hypothetical protein n=1 Tax=unclassified Streptomyces TaxID=2593676 RepID=UPI00131A25CF
MYDPPLDPLWRSPSGVTENCSINSDYWAVGRTLAWRSPSGATEDRNAEAIAV